VIVDGDGTHFSAVVVSEEFQGKSMVQQHQLVYKTLGDKVGADIHALSLKTLTPDEWEKEKYIRTVSE
jgi:acid stress-induced BolA-like protein IbaG/YrbA